MGVILLLAAGEIARGAHFYAVDPLRPVLFSIDAQSPTTMNQPGLSIRASDVLEHPGPTIRIGRARLNLNNTQDQIDGLSFAYTGFGVATPFVLRFSMDRGTFIGAPPDPDLVAQGFLFNPRQQAQLNQAAGDDFVSLRLFNRNGIIPLGANAERGAFDGDNSTLDRDQGDAGGVDYSLIPEIGVDENNPGQQDDLKAGADEGMAALFSQSDNREGRGVIGARPLFFSLEKNSPSLVPLPGPDGGAVIFVDFNTDAPGGEQVYVFDTQIGLVRADDIEDFIVFDNGDFVFNRAQDQVLFSLARGSPSLDALGATPADVLSTTPTGLPLRFFALQEQLGLSTGANIDMLELAVCMGPFDNCIRDWAIGNKGLTGDMNCDGVVSVSDIAGLVLALTNPAGYEAAYPDCNPFNGDCNFDHNMTVGDIGCFVELLTGP